MIVRQFLQWLRTAPAGERAEATAALARAFLYSDISADDRGACEGAMLMQLDDPSPLVRLALAETLAASELAPPAVIDALATDQAEIASLVFERSPLLFDSDLVDHAATGNPAAQAAIARRPHLPRSVSAAIAEVGDAAACLTLIENMTAEIAPFSVDRIVERFGHLAAIRETLLAFENLAATTRGVRHCLPLHLLRDRGIRLRVEHRRMRAGAEAHDAFDRRGRHGWRERSSRTIRCGWKSRSVRRTPPRWPSWPTG